MVSPFIPQLSLWKKGSGIVRERFTNGFEAGVIFLKKLSYRKGENAKKVTGKMIAGELSGQGFFEGVKEHL